MYRDDISIILRDCSGSRIPKTQTITVRKIPYDRDRKPLWVNDTTIWWKKIINYFFVDEKHRKKTRKNSKRRACVIIRHQRNKKFESLHSACPQSAKFYADTEADVCRRWGRRGDAAGRWKRAKNVRAARTVVDGWRRTARRGAAGSFCTSTSDGVTPTTPTAEPRDERAGAPLLFSIIVKCRAR